MFEPPLNRFESKFVKKGKDDCWEWDASISNNGYGRSSMKGYPSQAHRVAYILYIGEIPDGMCVLHKCDNRRCVNPSHLFLGTYKDNAVDCTNKGRSPSARLTVSQVLTIRSSTESQIVLARRYGVSVITIYRIRKRISYSHLDG